MHGTGKKGDLGAGKGPKRGWELREGDFWGDGKRRVKGSGEVGFFGGKGEAGKIFGGGEKGGTKWFGGETVRGENKFFVQGVKGRAGFWRKVWRKERKGAERGRRPGRGSGATCAERAERGDLGAGKGPKRGWKVREGDFGGWGAGGNNFLRGESILF